MNENKDAQTGAAKNPPEEKSMAHKLGDKIERVGEKIADMGAEKIGKAIHDAGDKIEHADDGKASKH